jgi:hypothetical protein
MNKRHWLFIFIVIFLLLTVSAIADYNSNNYWVIDFHANLDTPVLVRPFYAKSGRLYGLYRAFDWQTGNIIYITVFEGNGVHQMCVAPITRASK